jgi:hypothetical protein
MIGLELGAWRVSPIFRGLLIVRHFVLLRLWPSS